MTAPTPTLLDWPIPWPVTPYLGEDAGTIDVSTCLTYPAKAERPAATRGSRCCSPRGSRPA